MKKKKKGGKGGGEGSVVSSGLVASQSVSQGERGSA